MAQTVKNLFALQQLWVRSLGQEDALEKEMAYHFSILYSVFRIQNSPVFLPGEVHGERSLMGYSPWGCKESDMAEQLSLKMQESC